MKRLFTVGVLLLQLTKINAQSEAMITQNLNNPLMLNPAYSGSHEYLGLSAMHRGQWLNIDGAPETSVITAEGLLPGKKIGGGLVVAHDRIGITRQTDIYSCYSYHLKLSEKSKLSFGLRAGVSSYSYHLSDALIWDKSDQVYDGGVSKRYVPRAGFGMYYYRERSFISFSVPSLYSYRNSDRMSGSEVASMDRHYYLGAAYVFKLSPSLELKPFMQVRYHKSAPMEADFSVNAFIKNTLWIGGGYRTQDGFIGMMEYQLNSNLRVGYAYDMTTSALASYTSGTHEIVIGYDFIKDKNKTRNPRFF